MKINLTAFVFGIIISASVFAQLSSYNFQSTSSTFTAETGGTVLGTTANDEEVFNNNSTGETAPQTDIGFPIGFDFFYNGIYYDRFAVSNNGWIVLGSGTFTIGKTSTPISISTTSGFANAISAMGRDLQGQTGSELCYKLTGSEPNRVLVIQWLGYRRYNISSGENLNFQIKLNEADNSVTFAYGTITTTNTSTSSSGNPTQVGLRGATNSDYKNRTTTSSWSSSSAGTINTSTMRLTTTVKPSSGLVYNWQQANMSYASSTTLTGETALVKKNSVNNVLIKVQVVMNGGMNPLSVTGFTFNTSGSTSAGNISKAKAWFTGLSSVFDPSVQFGSTVNNPSGSFTVTGSQELQSGTNYFWLSYDVPSTAVTGNVLDAQCNSITVVTSKTPSTQSPSGSRTIAGSPLNGNYTIGLNLFNKVSSKDLYFRKVKTKVVREFPVSEDNLFQKTQDKESIGITGKLRTIFKESETDSFILMDGNSEYSGTNYIEFSQEIKNRFSSDNQVYSAAGIYASITAAFGDLNTKGIDGPVNFFLTDEVYSGETFPITLSEDNGSNAVKTITLKPSAGITPQIIMNSGIAVFKLYNTGNFILDGSNTAGGTTRDLSIISNDTNISYGVWLGSKSGNTVSDISIKNCNIKTGENSKGSVSILISDGVNASSAGYFDNINIVNNLIQKNRQGIYVIGGTTHSNISDLTISGNLINSTGADAAGFMGIYVQGVTAGNIRINEIGNLNPAAGENDKGIWISSGSQNIKVERNKIYNIGNTGTNGNGGHGIYVSPGMTSAGDTICNNVIYNIYGDGWNYLDPVYFLDNPIGIALYSSAAQNGISILNNSINLYGNTLLSPGSASFGIFAAANSTVEIRNNIICNKLGEGADTAYGSCGVYAQNSYAQFSAIDYNNYYINPSGNGVKSIGKISNSIASLSLDSWRTATHQDRSSISYDPGYTSNTDLSPNVNNSNIWSLNGRAQQNLSVNIDINGSIRSTTTQGGAPDIGAYEFTPAVQPPLISGTGSVTEGSSTLFIFGGDTLASIVWHGTVLPSTVTLKYFSGTNPPSPSTGNYGNSYWSFAATGGSGYTFDLTLFWDPAELGSVSGVNNISIANYTAGTWEHYNASSNISARTVLHNGLSKLTTFTIDDSEAPLPVELMYFNHITEGRNVILNWATSNEINNKGFEIERSSAVNKNWQKVGFISGKGTTSLETSYEFRDPALSTGAYNYRLKQTDYSGNFEIYDLSTAVVIGKPVSFKLGQNYPNPSNPKAKIDYQVPLDTRVSILIYDIQGREVKKLFEGFAEAGYYSIEFDGTDLASGIYFYRILAGDYSKSMKLILVK